jgi:putative transposase
MEEISKGENSDEMTRVYRSRLYPTVKQIVLLNAMLADHCTMYNAALEETRLAWKHPSKTNASYYDQCKQLKYIRSADPLGLGRWSSASEQQTLRRLHIARAAFSAECVQGTLQDFLDTNP